jgi:hypothetical protein
MFSGVGFMDKVSGTKIFGKSNESLVRLAKAFAGKKRHMSCVRIRIRDVGKGNLSKQRYPYVTITGLGEKHDERWGGMSLELCYYNLSVPRSTLAEYTSATTVT